MARLIKMDPARQPLFMRLQDKMNASCLWKSSRAVFSPACCLPACLSVCGATINRASAAEPGTTRGFHAAG